MLGVSSLGQIGEHTKEYACETVTEELPLEAVAARRHCLRYGLKRLASSDSEIDGNVAYAGFSISP